MTGNPLNIEQADFSITGEAWIWKGLFNIAGMIRDELRISVDQNEVCFKLVEAAHICMAEVHIEKARFTDYNVKMPGDISLKIDEIRKCLKMTKDQDLITISTVLNPRRNLKPERQYVLDLKVQTPEIVQYIMLERNENYDHVVARVLSINLTMKFKVPYKKMQRATQLMNNVGTDSVTIQADKEELRMLQVTTDYRGEHPYLYSQQNFTGKDYLEVEWTPKTDPPLIPEAYVETNYPLDYFGTPFGKGELSLHKWGGGKSPLFEYVQMEFASDYPMRMTFAGNGITVMYLLAPRIESE